MKTYNEIKRKNETGIIRIMAGVMLALTSLGYYLMQ